MFRIYFFVRNRKKRAARRSRPFCWRDTEASVASASLKPGSYAKLCLGGLETELVTSKHLRAKGADGNCPLLLLPITGLLTKCDEPAKLSGTAMYSRWPSSRTSQKRTPERTTDGPSGRQLPLWAPNQRSLVCFDIFRRTTTFSRQNCKSDTSCWLHPSPNTDHRF